ncbi:hypothetical protein KFE96_02785 [Kordiimonas sp. SCSIO 12603]|uniref:DUF6492 family protein n=1 Tax=Kordiimonas sp. SCSIO 12603 TaxID=2829596 RepID=UPI0021033862|nr:DUF6492 family protein [Kordiimonas sp. SCSIO 12603]UTW59251.1 hypothetical protein KFE96_02785 [Kordiimonas sp. SCSIO 12603]
MDQKTDIVVVAFCGELRLLQLQARSFAKYLDPSIIGTIHVILHDNNEHAFTAYFNKYILPEYGPFKSKVRLTTYTTLLGHSIKSPDWWSQQSVKLLASNLIETKHYLILDCKNHFIRPSGFQRLYTNDGRMLLPLNYYHADFDENLKAAYTYFGGKGPLSVEKSLPTITPFLAKTQIVKDLITHIETQENRSFHTVFMEKKFTEFFLYFGYLLACYGGIKQFYANSGPIVRTYFADYLKNPENIENSDTYIKYSSVYALGVHKEVVAIANDALKQRIISHWKNFNLVENEQEALYFLTPHTVTARPQPKQSFWNVIRQKFRST